MRTSSPATTAAILLVAFTLAYVPDLSHGFISDDFAWIEHGRLDGERTLGDVFSGHVGFYRPVVSLSFGLNYSLFSTWSLGYGLTNLLLVIGCAAGVWFLARSVGLSSMSALVASALWAFNFHGINMSLLWLSGRTSLLLTFFGLWTVFAASHRHSLGMFVGALLALASKEEAVVLPAICAVWASGPWKSGRWQDHARRLVHGVRRTWSTLVALIVYLAARTAAGAYTAGSAPPYYQFTFRPEAVAENILQYADRSMTVFAIAAVMWALATGVVPSVRNVDRDLLVKSLAWFAGGFAITIWLPVRSSLYAVFPSVGIALLTGAVLGAMTERASPVRQSRAAIGALALPFLLLPIYWSRNDRWVELAELTTKTARVIESQGSTIQAGSVIELHDDRSTRANFASAFAGLVDEASSVLFDGRFRLWIAPAAAETQGTAAVPPGPVGAVFELRGGDIVRVR